MARPKGLRPEYGHPALLVAHLDSPNFSPRAQADRISDSSDPTGICVDRPSIAKWLGECRQRHETGQETPPHTYMDTSL